MHKDFNLLLKAGFLLLCFYNVFSWGRGCTLTRVFAITHQVKDFCHVTWELQLAALFVCFLSGLRFVSCINDDVAMF